MRKLWLSPLLSPSSFSSKRVLRPSDTKLYSSPYIKFAIFSTFSFSIPINLLSREGRLSSEVDFDKKTYKSILRPSDDVKSFLYPFEYIVSKTEEITFISLSLTSNWAVRIATFSSFDWIVFAFLERSFSYAIFVLNDESLRWIIFIDTATFSLYILFGDIETHLDWAILAEESNFCGYILFNRLHPFISWAILLSMDCSFSWILFNWLVRLSVWGIFIDLFNSFFWALLARSRFFSYWKIFIVAHLSALFGIRHKSSTLLHYYILNSCNFDSEWRIGTISHSLIFRYSVFDELEREFAFSFVPVPKKIYFISYMDKHFIGDSYVPLYGKPLSLSVVDFSQVSYVTLEELLLSSVEKDKEL